MGRRVLSHLPTGRHAKGIWEDEFGTSFPFGERGALCMIRIIVISIRSIIFSRASPLGCGVSVG